MEHEGDIEFLGEPRPCVVWYDTRHEIPTVQRVVIALRIPHDYLPNGKFAPWIECTELDVMPILSQEQIWYFVQEIREAARKEMAEEVTESQLLKLGGKKTVPCPECQGNNSYRPWCQLCQGTGKSK